MHIPFLYSFALMLMSLPNLMHAGLVAAPYLKNAITMSFDDHAYQVVAAPLQTLAHKLPSIEEISAQTSSLASSFGRATAGDILYRKVPKPLFFVVAHNGAAIATVIFSSGVNGQALLDLASERLGQYGAIALNGFTRGATQQSLKSLKNDSYNLYLKPLVSGSIGLVGMTLACTAVPSPALASSAYSVFQSMTVTSAAHLAKNISMQIPNSAPVQKLIKTAKKPEHALFNNALIVTGALGVIALSPVLIGAATAAGSAIASSAVATQITGVMALNFAIDSLNQMHTSAIDVETAQYGAQTWKQVTDFVSAAINERSSQQLLRATRADNYDSVVDAVQKGADVNIVDSSGATPLIINSKLHGDYRILDLLINQKAHVNAQDNLGMTALMYEVSEPQPAVQQAITCKPTSPEQCDAKPLIQQPSLWSRISTGVANITNREPAAQPITPPVAKPIIEPQPASKPTSSWWSSVTSFVDSWKPSLPGQGLEDVWGPGE